MSLDNNVSLVILVIPTIGELNQQEFENDLQFYGLNPEEFDMLKIHKYMKEFGEEEGIKVIDLQPGVSKMFEDSEPKLYMDTDPHWTPEGHRLVAELIADDVVDVLE